MFAAVLIKGLSCPTAYNYMDLIDRYFDDLVKCIVDDLTYDNLQCHYAEMTQNIAEPSVFHEWSQLYDWNYYEFCAGKLKPPEQYSKCPKILYTKFGNTVSYANSADQIR